MCLTKLIVLPSPSNTPPCIVQRRSAVTVRAVADAPAMPAAMEPAPLVRVDTRQIPARFADVAYEPPSGNFFVPAKAGRARTHPTPKTQPRLWAADGLKE